MTEKNTVKTENGVEVYENEIYYFLDEYAKKWEIDLHDIDMSRWNSCLIFIYNNTFKNTSKLKRKPYELKTSKGTVSNNNSYDMDTLLYILSVYISICFEYSKEISITGYCLLTGINRQDIYNWGYDKTNQKGLELYKTLLDLREESLSNKLYSSKGNPVGILGILNRWYGWNMGQPHGSTESKPKTIEQIQENYIEQKDTTPTNNEKTGENRE